MASSPHRIPQFASSLSNRPSLTEAVDQVGVEIKQALTGPATHAVFFVSHAFADDWDDLAARLGQRIGTDQIIGCSGEGVIGVGNEIEEGPGLAVWAGQLPHADIVPLRLQFERTPEGGAIVGWPDSLIADWPEDGTLLLLADPFTFPVDYMLERLNDEHPGTPVIGGMASGATLPGRNRLFHGELSHAAGAVGWMVRRGVSVHSLVSQGCRPIGEKLVVTGVERNLLLGLGGKPALAQLQRIYQELPTHEQALVQNGLHVGRVVSEYLDEPQMGDFLIRNVIGIDHETGAIAVGDYLRVGQTVQFHLREERAAALELRQLLTQHKTHRQPQSALLFSCNGRGTRMFDQPHHDARMVAEILGDLPVAGFFAQGELGPVGGKNFLHGFTASLALFETAQQNEGPSTG